MKRALVLLACLLATGCGDSSTGPAPDGVAREVRAMFAAYTAAMGREDFAAACTHLSRGALGQLASGGDHGARTCAGLLSRLYTPRARQDLKQLVRTVKVTGVHATDKRDEVLLSWSAEVRGHRVAIRQPVVRVGDTWRLGANPTLTR